MKRGPVHPDGPQIVVRNAVHAHHAPAVEVLARSIRERVPDVERVGGGVHAETPEAVEGGVGAKRRVVPHRREPEPFGERRRPARRRQLLSVRHGQLSVVDPAARRRGRACVEGRQPAHEAARGRGDGDLLRAAEPEDADRRVRAELRARPGLAVVVRDRTARAPDPDVGGGASADDVDPRAAIERKSRPRRRKGAARAEHVGQAGIRIDRGLGERIGAGVSFDPRAVVRRSFASDASVRGAREETGRRGGRGREHGDERERASAH